MISGFMHRHMNRSMALYFIHLMIPTTWKKWLHFDKVRLRQSFELDMQLKWTSFRLLIVLSLFTFWISQPPALVSWRIQPSGPFRDFDRRDATVSWSNVASLDGISGMDELQAPRRHRLRAEAEAPASAPLPQQANRRRGLRLRYKSAKPMEL